MKQAIIIHSDDNALEKIRQQLEARDMEVLSAGALDSLMPVIETRKGYKADLVVIDLHIPNDGWLMIYRRVTRLYPNANMLFTTDGSDQNLLLRAKVHGAHFFLRTPYNSKAVSAALKRMAFHARESAAERLHLPEIKMPVRVKITLPYLVLGILMILGAAYITSRVARESVEERFLNQLISAARITNDWMVAEEGRMLQTLRLAINTGGVSDAVQANDATAARNILLPILVNSGNDAVILMDAQGNNVVTVWHDPAKGVGEYEGVVIPDHEFLSYEFVQKTYSLTPDKLGDKYAGAGEISQIRYFFVSAAVLDIEGNPVGVALVGNQIDNLTLDMNKNILAHITIYDQDGTAVTSTLYEDLADLPGLSNEDVNNVQETADEQTLVRPLVVGDENFREMITVWKARGDVELGLIGIALPETIFIRTSQETNAQIFIFLIIVLALIITTGLWLSNTITKPLLDVVEASSEISQGNLEVQVEAEGNDEIAVLAHSFNNMVEKLREGSMYADLLGRTVSPEVRDQLRSTLNSGNLHLEGQEAMATVMIADVQGFTTLSERENPNTILNWLNELFGEIAPIINSYSGVVNEFAGDAIFAFFGVLPRPLHMAESAYLACKAAVEMLEAINRVNRIRVERGDPELLMGIGIHSGPVTAGGLGTEDRLHYTIIGDTVNTTARIESLAHTLHDSGIMISRETSIAIFDKRDQFNMIPFGEHTVKGKETSVMVYRLLPKDVRSLIQEQVTKHESD